MYKRQPDPVLGARYLHELYTAAVPRYTGRVTVPMLWDRTRSAIVSNESAEIIRMFNSAFDALGAKAGDYYPQALREEIEAVNARVYDTLNNGVYKAGFATTQQAYEEAVRPLFETLDWLDERLATRRYLLGERLTLADVRLLTTLLRFDCVYPAISNATCVASPTTRISPGTCATCIKYRVSPRRSRSITSSATTTRVTAQSIRPVSCRSGRSSTSNPLPDASSGFVPSNRSMAR